MLCWAQSQPFPRGSLRQLNLMPTASPVGHGLTSLLCSTPARGGLRKQSPTFCGVQFPEKTSPPKAGPHTHSDSSTGIIPAKKTGSLSGNEVECGKVQDSVGVGKDGKEAP